MNWKYVLKSYVAIMIGIGLPIALVPLCLKDYDPLWLIGWLLMWANLCGWLEGRYLKIKPAPPPVVPAFTPELLETLRANVSMTASSEDRPLPSTDSADMYRVFKRLHDQPISFPEKL